MNMALWAEINTAVGAFGLRCLRPNGRYLRWHSEDVYEIRGAEPQRALMESLSGLLDIAPKVVSAAFETVGSGGGGGAGEGEEDYSEQQHRRRLEYGKYLSFGSNFNVTRAIACAETAIPGALEALNYPPQMIANPELSGASAEEKTPTLRYSGVKTKKLTSEESSKPQEPSSSSKMAKGPLPLHPPPTPLEDTLSPLVVGGFALAVVVWKRRRRNICCGGDEQEEGRGGGDEETWNVHREYDSPG
jgi:hypothetical protein